MGDRPVILNVDDTDSGRYATTKLLQREGFSIKEAASGRDAIEAAEREQPDLIVLDVNLPDISGLEVCRRLRSNGKTAAIPVLHLSATSVSEVDRARGLETGADAYLTQPVEPSLLVATIKALLRARRAEREVESAARQWQATFDSISHGVCIIDREGRIRKVNRALANLARSTEGELTGRMHHEMLPGLEKPEHGWPFDRVRVSLHREVSEIRAGDRWFELTADPILDEQGGFEGAIRTLIDITARKREHEERERLLRELEAERSLLTAVLGSLPVGAIIAEAPSGRIIMANERASAIMGRPVPLGGAAGSEEFKAYHQDGTPFKREHLPLVRAILAGESRTEEVVYERPDGNRVLLRIQGAPVRNEAGYVVAGVAAIEDITDRRLLEDQFRQSQKMEAVGRLAGGVAHDFNNLLTIIGGYGQMIADTLEPKDPVRQDIEAILEASNRATALTRQLLTFSRRQETQPKVLDLNRLVSKMNRMLRRVIGEDVELSMELKPGLGRIKADPAQIEQVLMNLAVNARDAMPKGGKLFIETSNVAVENGPLRKRTQLEPGRYVMLSMRDTGTGMDAEVRSHIFEPFYTTKPKGKGTGLGLSTVYGIVKQSGGEIEVESELGKGAAFRLYFPIVSEAGRLWERGRAAGAVLKGTETILVVEDEDEVRRFAKELLTRQGYTVLEAGSGPEALKILKRYKHRIDLLLTDVIMPQMSGRELAIEIRKLAPKIKVVYMSGYTDDVIAQHGVLEPGMEFLQKPFTHESLGRKLRKVLDAAARE